MPDSYNAKNQAVSRLRQQKRMQRQRLPASTQKQNSLNLRDQLTKDERFKRCRNVACYFANDGEIDPQPIIERAWSLRKKVYLPILSPLKNRLYFVPYEKHSKLKNNRFNIPEPVCQPSHWKTAYQLDLLLLPLVAFDTQGNRIGMGGGFYDRTLAYLQLRQFWKKPILIGLAHEIQKVNNLDSQSWDIPLNYIITEKKRYDT